MQLKWYELMGWIVELFLIIFAFLTLYTFFQERLWKAFWVGLIFFTVIGGEGLWVLLKYSKS